MHNLPREVEAVTRAKWLVLGCVILAGMVAGALSWAAPDPGVKRFLSEMYDLRARALITGESARGLDRYYDLSTQGGRFALAHETGRIEYMQAWAPARRLKVVEAQNIITNLRVKVEGDRATVSTIVRTKLGYRYDQSPTVNYMGVGSWHWLQLNRKDGRWVVAKEFYLDAMGSEWTEPYVPAAAVVMEPEADDAAPASGRKRFNREGARAYAEKYCGSAWGCGNKADYNQRYKAYRHLGGDCANFASQALTEGGDLKPDWTWRKGSGCWVNASKFTHYLAGSGKAVVLARGTYPKVQPALSKLEPGDIIAYQVKGTITHVSVVTGKDSGGVPVVAAHTADRYRNPWDLGWDKRTVFWLLHIRD